MCNSLNHQDLCYESNVQGYKVGLSRKSLKRYLLEDANNGYIIAGFSEQQVRTLYELLSYRDDIDFLTLSQLSDRVFKILNLDLHPLASQGQMRESLRYAISESNIESYREAFSKEGYIDAIQKLLSELRMWGINLEKNSKFHLPDQRLADLFMAFASIESLQNEIFKKLGVEHLSHRLQRCISNIDAEKKLGFLKISVVSDEALSPLMIHWLNWVSLQGGVVKIYIPHLNGRSDLFISFDQLLEKNGVKINHEEIKGDRLWYQDLFKGEKTLKQPFDVSVVSAPDTISECELIIEKCIEKFNQGIPPERIGLYVNNLDEYTPILKIASENEGVPLCFCMRTKLLENPFVMFFHMLLKFMVHLDIEILQKILMSSYLCLTDVEKTTILNQVHQFDRSSDLLMSLADEFGDEHFLSIWIKKIWIWQESYCHEKQSIQNWIQAIRLLLDIQTENFISDNPYDKDELIERDQRAALSMVRSLTEFASVHTSYSNKTLSLMELYELSMSIWNMEDVVYPYMKSGIKVSHQLSSFLDLDVLFILGAVEGTYPRKRREDILLSDDDRDTLSHELSLVNPLRTSKEDTKKCRDEFISMCGLPLKEIVFSYPLVSEDTENLPAFYLNELDRYLSGNINYEHHTRLKCVNKKIEKINKKYDNLIDQDFYSLKNLTQFNLDKIQPESIVQMQKCPFLAQFNLHLDVKNTHHNQLSVGKILRRIDWNKVSGLSDMNEMKRVLLLEVDKIIAKEKTRVSKWEKSILKGALSTRIHAYSLREELSQKHWRSNKLSDMDHSQFGLDGFRNVLKNGNEKINIDGSIPYSYLTSGSSVISLYENGYSYKHWNSNLNVDEGLLNGIYLLVQYNRAGSVGIEIDDLKDKRYLLLLPRFFSHELKSTSDGSLNIREVAESIPEYFEWVKGHIFQSWEKWKNGSCEPTINDGCKFCAYQALCRVDLEKKH